MRRNSWRRRVPQTAWNNPVWSTLWILGDEDGILTDSQSPTTVICSNNVYFHDSWISLHCKFTINKASGTHLEPIFYYQDWWFYLFSWAHTRAGPISRFFKASKIQLIWMKGAFWDSWISKLASCGEKIDTIEKEDTRSRRPHVSTTTLTTWLKYTHRY